MPDDTRTLAQVSEGALLAEIFPFFAGGPGMPVGPGDDAAVLATGPRTVATTDTMVRGRDWVDEWSSGADVAAKFLPASEYARAKSVDFGKMAAGQQAFGQQYLQVMQ